MAWDEIFSFGVAEGAGLDLHHHAAQPDNNLSDRPDSRALCVSGRFSRPANDRITTEPAIDCPKAPYHWGCQWTPLPFVFLCKLASPLAHRKFRRCHVRVLQRRKPS